MKKDFSIIIPVAPDRKAEVLKSVAMLDYPKERYEVIVEKGINPSRNRNKGAEKACGKILYFIDDDAVLDKDVLKNAWELFKDKDISVAGGPQLTPKDDKFFAKACGLVLASPFATAGMSNRYKRGKFNYNAGEDDLTSASMFVRASDYKKIGGFNEALFPGEDPEFLARAKSKGKRIVYSPDLIIYHRRRSNILSFMEQFFSYGQARVKKERMANKKPGLLFWLPACFFIYIAIIIATLLTRELPISFYYPLIIYAVLAVSVSAWINASRFWWRDRAFQNWYYIFLMPFLFFVLHCSYGLGMIDGALERIMPDEKEKWSEWE